MALLDASGQDFANTYTDAAGDYKFTSLPYGKYQVVVTSWGIERFVQPDYGGNQFDTTDSDVNAFGRSDVFELTPANQNADRDAGLLHWQVPTPAGAGEKSVRFLKPGAWVTPDLKVTNTSYAVEGIRSCAGPVVRVSSAA